MEAEVVYDLVAFGTRLHAGSAGASFPSIVHACGAVGPRVYGAVACYFGHLIDGRANGNSIRTPVRYTATVVPMVINFQGKKRVNAQGAGYDGPGWHVSELIDCSCRIYCRMAYTSRQFRDCSGANEPF